VVFVDHFGNLITNLPGEALTGPDGAGVQVRVGSAQVPHCVRTYAGAKPGSLVALVSSSGRLEVAVVQGSATERLRAGVGTPVEVMPG